MVQNKTLVSINIIMLIFLTLLTVAAILTVFVIMPRIVKSEEVQVPDLVGKMKDECITILEEHGLQLDPDIEEREDPLVDAGFVIEQEPPANFRVKIGKPVHIAVSSGAQLVEVPNIVGKSLEDAEAIINREHLEIGYQARAHSKHYPKTGTVIAQTPLAGTQKVRDSAISLLVSLGTREKIYVVPALTKMKFSEVKTLLSKYPLEVGKVDYNPKSFIRSGIIMSHRPREGQLITAGGTIDFEVSGGQAQASEKKTRAVVIRYTVPKSDKIETIHITIVVEDALGSKRIIDGDYYPTTTIQHPYTVTGDAVMKVYRDGKSKPIYEEDL